ncbi:hypothetical protein MWU54_00470 [Marivita sp. S6314]|nr:hypothetical protein [Marivita sp. S6314]
MEGWPITRDNLTFLIEREKNKAIKILLSVDGVDVKHAPLVAMGADEGVSASITIRSDEYVQLAINEILKWQTVISGIQIFDINFDEYEVSYHPETSDEEEKILLKSYKGSYESLNNECDFEQIGRAFCVKDVDVERIEYTSHYRDGRLAFEVGRYIDAYNHFFLFLETRYCDGKTQTNLQTKLLLEAGHFISALKESIKEYSSHGAAKSKHLEPLFSPEATDEKKVKCIINLRGRLRHHSLKNPNRWDPNKHDEYKQPAQLLQAIVSKVVINSSISDIYSKDSLKMFQDISTSTGFETKLIVHTKRLNKEPALTINMSYPTVILSSKLCRTVLINAIEACAQNLQHFDTVRLDAIDDRHGLDVLISELGVWAYTKERAFEFSDSTEQASCIFERYRGGIVIKEEFSVPINASTLKIHHAWSLLKYCFERIDHANPTTRILSLKIVASISGRPILNYRVGAQIRN